MSYQENIESESNIASLREKHILANWKNLPRHASPIFKGRWPAITKGSRWYIAYRQNVDPLYPQQLLNIPVANSFADPSKHHDLSQMGLFIATPIHLTEEQISKLGNIYDIEGEGKDEVIDFVSTNFFLYELLLEAIPVFKACFGPDMRIDLVLRRDPEEGFQELFGYIHQARAIEETRSSLERFDNEWFLENLERTQGKLNFNLLF